MRRGFSFGDGSLTIQLLLLLLLLLLSLLRRVAWCGVGRRHTRRRQPKRRLHTREAAEARRAYCPLSLPAVSEHDTKVAAELR